MNDTERLRRYAAERSDDAFREIVHEHISLVYGTALRQLAGDAHLAQDVSQRVFVALARKAKQLQAHRFLAGWLYQCTRFEAARVVRAEGRRRQREQKAYAMDHLTSECAEPPLDWERLRPLLEKTIAALRAEDREA